MVIAAEVRRVLSKNPNKIELKHLQLSFQEPGEGKGSNLTREQYSAMARAAWIQRLGIPEESITYITKDSSTITSDDPVT